MPDSDTPEALPPQDQPESMGGSEPPSPVEPIAAGESTPPEEPAAELPPTYIGPAVDFGGAASAETDETPITPPPAEATPSTDTVVSDYGEPLPIPPEPAVRVYDTTPETPVEPAFESGPPPPRPDKSAFATPPPPPEEGKRNWLLYGLGGGALLICALCVCLIGLAAMSGALDDGTTVETNGENGNNGGSTVATATAGDSEPEPTVTISSEEISVFDLETGNCFNDPAATDDNLVEDIEIVDCGQPHDNEVFLTVDYEADFGADFPGEEEIDAFAEEQCLDAFETYVGLDFNDSILQVSYFQPTEGTWEDGDREIACFLYEDGAQLEGSMEGSER